ncbi:LysR family transcriptional regulator [Defluviimonas sp. WL0002]|uniref:LysR family transcriptional regulator n=1 Tax=Albidovulum marisflavi TaxID=2984159 RepID=A0ABT2ZGK9_9RHOB|nr:LysR family transcriptional regulator [Defluviimonas sp. WL0002]MCV2870272.1 LysR family transcriptional regulator [Defluviimonas sp. WL0002]
MDTVEQLRAFVATAQAGSFTAAADQLGISNRLTSKYVAELEQRLGVRLFQRTTRKVGLTPAGEDLLARAPALLDELDDLLTGASEGSRGFTGVIRISAPVTFGETYVVGMLGRFAQQHPDLTLDLRLDDRFVDLAAEGIDLAFRVGRSEMLSIKTRKLGEVQTFLVASPQYLARSGTPRTPADLAGHAFIVDTNRRDPRRWPLWKDGAETVVTVEGRLLVNSVRAACALAAAGKGIAFAPKFAIRDDLAAGRLSTLLDGYTGSPSPVSAAYLEGRTLPRKIRALIDFAASDIRSTNLL